MADEIPQEEIGIEESEYRMVRGQVEGDQAGCQLVRYGHLSPVADLDVIQAFVAEPRRRRRSTKPSGSALLGITSLGDGRRRLGQSCWSLRRPVNSHSQYMDASSEDKPSVASKMMMATQR